MPYGYGYGYYFDPTYLLVLIGVVISLWASAKVKTTYSKYSRVRSMSGLTGAQVADQILRANGIYDVRIEHVSGELTDHYDPKNRVLRLSDVVYNSTSVAALGVAAMSAAMRCRTTKTISRSVSETPWCGGKLRNPGGLARLSSSDWFSEAAAF